MCYDKSKIRIIAGGDARCPAGKKLTPKDLNYPKMTINLLTVPETNKTGKMKASPLVIYSFTLLDALD